MLPFEITRDGRRRESGGGKHRILRHTGSGGHGVGVNRHIPVQEQIVADASGSGGHSVAGRHSGLYRLLCLPRRIRCPTVLEAVSMGSQGIREPLPVCAVPVATIILSCLAFRGILRDHILVRSLDRIR